jgi:hypothetical protein
MQTSPQGLPWTQILQQPVGAAGCELLSVSLELPAAELSGAALSGAELSAELAAPPVPDVEVSPGASFRS